MMVRLATVLTLLAASALSAAVPRDRGAAIGVHAVQATPPSQRPTELVLSLTSPSVRPRIGLQDFAAAEPALGETARTMTEVLWADLDFEREFYMISRKSSSGLPRADTPDGLPFDRWAELGADFVLVGTLRDEGGGRLSVEIKLVGVRGAARGREDFSRRYDGCLASSPRFCAHSIADDMHKQIRDLDGVARTRIAFVSDREGVGAASRPNAAPGKEVYLIDYDGASPRRITTENHLNIAPSWGPDGRTLAWASYRSGYPDIFLATFDGRPATRPAQGTETIHNQNPAISPDGTKIAFTSNRMGQAGFYDIWVVNRDGTDLRNLTPGTERSSEGAPTWSPAGNQIAFTSDRTGTPQIYVMNADGTNVRRVTFDAHADRPAWSRLGFIAYTLLQGAGHDVAILDLASNQTRIVTDGLGSNKQPSVSPNGRHIVFVTTRWGREQLATIDYDGRNIRRLTDAGNNTYPNWSPTPGGR